MVGSEHLLPSISSSTSTPNSSKYKKSKRSTSDSLVFNEEDSVQTHTPKNQTFRDDPATLQAMTLQQLRSMSRNFGIPARGSKHDLMLALMRFLDNDKDGPSSPITLELVPFEVKPSHPENTPSRRKANNSSVGNHAQNLDFVSEVSGNEQIKRRGKPSSIDGTDVKANSKSVITKQKLSVKADEVPVPCESTSSKRRAKNLSGGGHAQNPNPVSDVPGFQYKKRKGKPPASHDTNTNPSPAMRGSSRTGNEDGGSTDGVGLFGNPSEPWTVLAHKKPQQGWVPYNPRTMRPPLAGGTDYVKLISWNVNGLRALMKSEGFSALAKNENFDVLCLQETKLQEKDVEKIKLCLIDGYENSFWTCSVSKLGYSGTAIISRIKPLSVRYGLGIPDHDTEGRLVTVEFDTFYLINGYVPNSGDGLKRLTYRVAQWDPSLVNYMKELEKLKPVILAGDLNCAHQEIDIFNPAGNRRSAGFTDEERESFGTNLLSKGFVDTFRRQHPGVVGYTYWGYRHRARVTNKGWRLDYFLVSESIADKIHDSYILPDVLGSDHCPIGLIVKL